MIHLRKDELIAMVKELRKEKAILEANNKVLELESYDIALLPTQMEMTVNDQRVRGQGFLIAIKYKT